LFICGGGGHWNLVVGCDPKIQQLLIHHLYGEADLVAGGLGRTTLSSGTGLR
jgi:hypothetical protein